ncbi:MAG: ABC transporter permease [Candidatus ainarchaeum sp.]|nr:ABC transporter permease [Candidatus ainarchaeum sp.]
MKTEEAFVYALRSITGKKLRSWLTLVGIIIGIVTIISIVSIGDGVKKDINDQLSMFGSDYIIVMPFSMEGAMASISPTASPTTGKLFEKDVSAVEKVPGIGSVAKLVYGIMSVEFKDVSVSSPVFAVSSSMFTDWADMLEIEEGRGFKDSENNVAVIGYDAANELFGKNKIKVGSSIIINGEKFRVVGILKKIGTSMSQSDDAAIYIPFDKGRDMLGNFLAKDEVSFIYIRAQYGADVNEIKENIEYELASLHKVKMDELDFTVMTAESMQEMIGGIIETLGLFLLLIAGIASAVSGVGIMNTMFMSIMEKTREIGVLKSIGASEKDIAKIFLMESAIIGGFGGILGIIFGVIIALIVGSFGILVVLTPTLIIGSFLFSLSIGLGAGYIPAKRAAGMNPIEALRN